MAKEKSRDRVLDDTELKLTWEAADRKGGPAGALVKLLILTGARRNEITELSRDEIKKEAIELPSERTKSATPHVSGIRNAAAHRQICAQWYRSTAR
jgi:integrase